MELGNLLERFRVLYTKEKDKKEGFILIVRECTSIELTERQIVCEKNIITIQGIHPLQKKHIIEQKKKLLEELFSRTGIRIETIQ